MTKSNNDGLAARLATLTKMKINELRAAYARQTGKPANRLGRDALIKTLAAHHDTPPVTKTPAAEEPPTTATKRRARPATGTVLERTYKKKVHKVTVRADAFEYAGESYTSLTAVAKAITGYPSISGTLFFGVAQRAAKPDSPATATPPRTKAARKGRKG